MGRQRNKMRCHAAPQQLPSTAFLAAISKLSPSGAHLFWREAAAGGTCNSKKKKKTMIRVL